MSSVVGLAEDLPHELLARLLRELLEPELLDAALGEDVGEEVLHLGPREREDHERLVVDGAQRGVDELHAREIAPVQVLEDEHDRLPAALGEEPVLEGAAHLIAHQDRVVARGAELDVVLVGHRDAEDLAEELRDAQLIALRDVTRDARADLLALHARRLAVLRAGGGADDLREQAERRAGAHRIAARGPHLVRVAAVMEHAKQLVAEARLADAGGRGDEHDARDVVGDALGEDALEHDELALATDARRRLAEEHAPGVDGGLLADELEAGAVALHREARVEEAGGHLVDVDRLLLAGREVRDVVVLTLP